MKQSLLLILVAAVLSFSLLNSCQRSLSDPGPEHIEDPPMANLVRATITGRVLDDEQKPVSGAAVKAGTSTGTTSVNGEFKLENVLLNEDAGFVKVEKDGFFQGSRTFSVKANSKHYVHIELIKKITAGTFSGSSGGNVTVSNGGSISFPAAAVVNTTGNTAYSGTVTVHAFFLNPEADNFDGIMPGALRGINTSNQPVILQSFGMMAVELTGAGGEKLQLASGKEATITFPIPSSLQGQAPASIPLWSFNDSTGLWKEEGSATKQGGNYVGKTSHFSFWNVDVPNQFINFNATIKDQNNNPVIYAQVKITDPSTGVNGYGYTNDSGAVGGPIPINKSLQMVIYNKCGIEIHSQNIGPFATSANLGTITVTNIGTNAVTFTGTVENCSGSPVANGFVDLYLDSTYYRATVTNGNFSTIIDRCNTAATTAKVLATDLGTSEQGTETSVNVTGASVNTGTLTACGTSITQFVDFTINGTQYNMVPPADSLRALTTQGLTRLYGESIGGGPRKSFFASFVGTSTGTYQLSDFAVHVNNNNYIRLANMDATITEYGPAGSGYISGTLTGDVVRDSTNIPVLPFSSTFRIKRQ